MTTAVTEAPASNRRKVRSRTRLARLNDAGGGLDDRLGNFHRLVHHRATGRRARLVAGGVACDRSAHLNGRAFLRRARRDDAEGRRTICLSCAKHSRRCGDFFTAGRLFLVIQTGTIAAVAVGFARYTGVLVPWVSESNYLIAPIRFGGYAFSLSTAQFVGLVHDCAAHLHEHARTKARQARAECLHHRQDRRAHRR